MSGKQLNLTLWKFRPGGPFSPHIATQTALELPPHLTLQLHLLRDLSRVETFLRIFRQELPSKQCPKIFFCYFWFLPENKSIRPLKQPLPTPILLLNTKPHGNWRSNGACSVAPKIHQGNKTTSPDLTSSCNGILHNFAEDPSVITHSKPEDRQNRNDAQNHLLIPAIMPPFAPKCRSL